MQQAGYHHVNLLANQFREDLEARDHAILTLLKSLDTSTNAPSTQTAMSTITPATHQANAATNTDVQMEMITLLCKIEENLKPVHL